MGYGRLQLPERNRTFDAERGRRGGEQWQMNGHGKLAVVLSALPFLTGLALCACGGDEPKTRAPIAHETPADEILRIGHTWTATGANKGLLTPPSQISMFDVSEESRITLEPKSAQEELVIGETVKLRNGNELHCSTTIRHDLEIRWGFREGEPAVQLTRPAISAPRVCDHPGHPEPTITRPGGPVRFVLRSDNLVAVDPATDGRVYRSVD
jgi:hypothetical protein